MPGPTPKPPETRRNFTSPSRGEWEALDAVGWQYGAVPDPPDGLLRVTLNAWATWMASWVAAHWTSDDLPGLEVLISIYDQVRRGEYQRANELRLQMDNYGLTPKGQQDRRWRRPGPAEKAAPVKQIKTRRLKAV